MGPVCSNGRRTVLRGETYIAPSRPMYLSNLVCHDGMFLFNGDLRRAVPANCNAPSGAPNKLLCDDNASCFLGVDKIAYVRIYKREIYLKTQ